MQTDTTYKTIHQYNSIPIPKEDMVKLQEIAQDYAKVKNETYQRYGSIHGLLKLYPGYSIQKEMADSGLRETLGLPSVYFNLAVFDALADIKSQWTRTKSRILENINQRTDFTEEEKHYLRFLLKVNNCFVAVLNQTETKFPEQIQQQWEQLQEKVNREYLHRYLCRQVRKYHVKLYTEQNMIFSLTERAYRYGNHGIYISMKEKRKRIFIQLRDKNQYDCQISIKLFPEQNKIELYVPVKVKVRQYNEYVNHIGLAAGMYTMFTTNEGHCYGERLGEYQIPYANWIRQQTICYYHNKKNNLGRKKYFAKKHRLEEQLHSYINQELNRFHQFTNFEYD